MQKLLKHFSAVLLMLFTLSSCSNKFEKSDAYKYSSDIYFKPSSGIYGFLLDEYSGDSIECIAYINYLDVYDAESVYIEKFYTQFGYVELDDYLMFENGEFERFTLGNDLHSLGFTHDTDFKFIISRNASDKDFERLSARKNLLDEFFVQKDGNEYTLHYTNSSCELDEQAVYVGSYSESSLFRAGFCEKCFPEMYDENF